MYLFRCRRQLSDVLAFSCQKLQPALMQTFLLQLIQHKYIHGNMLTELCLTRILRDSTQAFGRHTGLYHLRYDSARDSVLVTSYCWQSYTVAPWGHIIPVQCPQCGAIEAWKYPNHMPNKGETVVVSCRGIQSGSGGESDSPCTYKLQCPPPG